MCLENCYLCTRIQPQSVLIPQSCLYLTQSSVLSLSHSVLSPHYSVLVSVLCPHRSVLVNSVLSLSAKVRNPYFQRNAFDYACQNDLQEPAHPAQKRD